MKLQIRKYINGNPKFLISIWIAFIVINALVLFSSFFIASIFHKLSLGAEHNKSLILIVPYFLFINPLIMLLSFYTIMKYVKNNNPILLSALVGLLSALILSGIEFLILDKFNPYSIPRCFISVTGLIITWIIVIQTQENITKALSSGYFIYCLLIVIFALIESNMHNNKFELWPLIGSIIGGIVGCGIISKIFEPFIKLTIWLLKLKLSDEETNVIGKIKMP